MFVKPFHYERASSMGQAAEALRAGDGAVKVLAGGQSLLPMINMGLVDLDGVVDISHVPEGHQIAIDGGSVVIGALVRHCALVQSAELAVHQPLVGAAASWIGNPRIRGRGTIGGSLAHSDPAAELPVALIAAGAQYLVSDGLTERALPADGFHESFFTTALAPDELVTAVRIPALQAGWGWGFREIARRRGDFALASAAVLLRAVEGRVVTSRIAVGGVGERPLRLPRVEERIVGARPAEFADRIGEIEGIEPVGDTNAGAAYRRRVCRVVVARALVDAFDRSGEG